MAASRWAVSMLPLSLPDTVDAVGDVGVLISETFDDSSTEGRRESAPGTLIVMSGAGLFNSEMSFTELKDSGNNLQWRFRQSES